MLLFVNIHEGFPVYPLPPHISSWSRQLSTSLNGLVALTGTRLQERQNQSFWQLASRFERDRCCDHSATQTYEEALFSRWEGFHRDKRTGGDCFKIPLTHFKTWLESNPIIQLSQYLDQWVLIRGYRYLAVDATTTAFAVLLIGLPVFHMGHICLVCFHNSGLHTN